MAKKSTSPAKKAIKSGGKPMAKAAAKPAKKVAAKPAKKAEAKPAKKAVKMAPEVAKPQAKKAELKAKDSKPASTPAASKSNEKMPAAKPALMTKKGKLVESEELSEASPTADTAPAKAEKASKVKPIRIEKGNAEDEKAKWAELFKKYGKDKAIPYKMSDSFPNLSPLQHKVLGWGFILKNDNDRLEVLFETGIRMLISNYKSS